MASIPLENAEVLRRILEQFSNTELLKLSIVNKQWNFEARSVLKDRGDLTAIFSSVDPCRSLVAFASDLRKMRVVPFSEIHILLFHYPACQSSSSGSLLGPSQNPILNQLPYKHLSVTFRDTWDKCRSCEAVELVRKIVEDSHGVLEELSLTFENGVEQEMFEQVFQRPSFPHLTILKIQGYEFEDSTTNFIRALVSHAPKLEELKFDGGLFFHENVLEGSSAVLVPAHEFHPLYEGMCDGIIGCLRAETIAVFAIVYLPFEVESLNMAVPMMLQASHLSLKTLRMDFLFAVPLMCYGICLENVTKLMMGMASNSLEHIEPHILAIIKRFDFTRVFPKLQHVQISSVCCGAFFTSDQISSFVERGTAGSRSILPDRAVNIKQLTLSESNWESALPFWAQTLPHVQTLSVDMGGENLSEFPFTLFWELFVRLEELNVKTVHWGLSMAVNSDSVFCGIFPEEVAELMQKDEEYLRAVNIVPVMPAITCLRGLRTFKLDFSMSFMNDDDRLERADRTFLFSKVTALIGFRCPDLTVTFRSNAYSVNALNHMRPYVNFASK